MDHNKDLIIKFDYSYLVIAKPSMLNNDYTNIKETLFQDLKKLKMNILNIILIKFIKFYKLLADISWK